MFARDPVGVFVAPGPRWPPAINKGYRLPSSAEVLRLCRRSTHTHEAVKECLALRREVANVIEDPDCLGPAYAARAALAGAILQALGLMAKAGSKCKSRTKIVNFAKHLTHSESNAHRMRSRMKMSF